MSICVYSSNICSLSCKTSETYCYLCVKHKEHTLEGGCTVITKSICNVVYTMKEGELERAPYST